MKQNYKEEQQENELQAQNHRYLGNERWHGRLLEVEEWEQIRAAGLRKLIVSPERAADIQGIQTFEDIGRPLHIAMGGMSHRIAPKIRVPKKLREKTEKQLAMFGLSLQQQKLQDTQTVFVPVPEGAPKSAGITIEGIDRHAFDAFDGKSTQCSDKITFAEAKRFGRVRTREYERLIPGWICYDSQLQSVIEAMYPKWNKNQRWRKRAAKTAAVLYKYFRVLESTEAIGEGLELSVRQVENIIARARKVAKQQFPKRQPVSQAEFRVAA